jgi:hypothetical protein
MKEHNQESDVGWKPVGIVHLWRWLRTLASSGPLSQPLESLGSTYFHILNCAAKVQVCALEKAGFA